MKNGARIVAAIVVSLGVTVAVAAMQTHRELGHGAFCGRLAEEHVKDHADHLRRWTSDELALTAEQSAAFEPVVESLSDWAREMEPICSSDRTNAPEMVASAVQIADITQRGATRFAAAFDDLYATLDDEQRRVVDGWFTHEHGHHGFHERTE